MSRSNGTEYSKKRNALQKIRKVYRAGNLSPEQIRRVEEIGIKLDNDRILKIGDNDLATTKPKIAAEWNYEKNYPLTPKDVVAGSNKKAWWRCSKGHEWETKIVTRTRTDGSCPYCSNKWILRGFNDLATTNPEIAAQWHPTKNGNLKPADVMAGSNRKVWWLCSKCGHEWEAQVLARARQGSGCPVCSKRNKKHSKKREIECVELAKRFPSMRAAAREFGKKNANSIMEACHDPMRTAYGYHWRYADQEEAKR